MDARGGNNVADPYPRQNITRFVDGMCCEMGGRINFWEARPLARKYNEVEVGVWVGGERRYAAFKIW